MKAVARSYGIGCGGGRVLFGGEGWHFWGDGSWRKEVRNGW